MPTLENSGSLLPEEEEEQALDEALACLSISPVKQPEEEPNVQHAEVSEAPVTPVGHNTPRRLAYTR